MASGDRPTMPRSAGPPLAERSQILRHRGVDLIAGGFPCQDISTAGRGAGITGTRSGLWWNMVQTIRMVEPKYVIVENVAALLSNGMGTVLGDLAESGHNAEWDCLPASAFGSPHRRDRVFIVAYPQVLHGDGGDYNKGIGKCAEQIPESGNSSGPEITSDSECGGLQGRVFGCAEPPAEILAPRRSTTLGTSVGKTWQTEPGESWLDDGLSSEMAEFSSRAFGNAVVPQVAEWLGERIKRAMS